MSDTQISVCSKALLMLGASGITSFEEGTAEAETAAGLYPLIRDSLLSSYPWSFAITQKRLNQLAENPLADYSKAYLLPNDFLRVISAGRGSRAKGIEYRIFENKLYTNANEVNLTYIFRPEISSFPAFFIEALVAKLASEMCLILTEDSSRANYLLKKSEDNIKNARLIDSQQNTPQKFEDFSLIGARK